MKLHFQVCSTDAIALLNCIPQALHHYWGFIRSIYAHIYGSSRPRLKIVGPMPSLLEVTNEYEPDFHTINLNKTTNSVQSLESKCKRWVPLQAWISIGTWYKEKDSFKIHHLNGPKYLNFQNILHKFLQIFYMQQTQSLSLHELS